MKLVKFEAGRMTHPHAELIEFVQRIAAGLKPYQGPERRSEPRWGVTMPVPAAPLNEHLSPCGPTFLAISRDISTQGMGLYHVRPIEVKSLLGVELRAPQGDTMQAVLEVVRCQVNGPAFEIGGRFMAKVYDNDKR
jgi:hypothetical protein